MLVAAVVKHGAAPCGPRQQTKLDVVPAVDLTIIGKPDCHLCDVATEVIEQVLGELASIQPHQQVTVEKLSILDDPALHELYWEQIPVVLIDGEKHSQWRVDPARLRVAILNAPPRSKG